MPQAKDPVCGVVVEPGTSAPREQYAGVTLYFCSHACQERFRASPEQYVWKLQGPV